jgi:hypothetical protein
LPNQVRHRQAQLGLFHHRDDLLNQKALSLHASSPFLAEGKCAAKLTFALDHFRHVRSVLINHKKVARIMQDSLQVRRWRRFVQTTDTASVGATGRTTGRSSKDARYRYEVHRTWAAALGPSS